MFGATKLNKILYHADFLAFAKSGRSITGAQYMRQRNVPVPRHLVPVRDKMLANRDIAIRPGNSYSPGKTEQRVVPLVESDLSQFDSWQIALVDAVIRDLWNQSGTEASDGTHGRAWKIAEANGSPIPYEAIFISDDPLTEGDIARTEELADRYGWYA